MPIILILLVAYAAQMGMISIFPMVVLMIVLPVGWGVLKTAQRLGL